MTTKVTIERLREVFAYDPVTGRFTRLVSTSNRVKPGDAPSANSHGYVRILIDGKRYAAHHLAWFWMTGTWPDGEVDHRDLNRGNNAWVNLRLATLSQNRANTGTRKHNKSGFKGVQKCRGSKTWTARISVDGKSKPLGSFPTPQEAHAAYVTAARDAFGEYARAA